MIFNFNKTSQIDNKAIETYNKGTLALQNKKYDKALKHFKESLRIAETTDCWLNLGTTYKFLDKDTLCREAFKKATSKDIYCMETSFSIEALAWNDLGLMHYVV